MKNCTVKPTYSKCADQHATDNCEAYLEKCVNCVKFNKRINSNQPVDHDVVSRASSVYKRNLEALKIL